MASIGLAGYAALTAAFLVIGDWVTGSLERGAVGDWERDVADWLVRERSSLADDLSWVGANLAHGVTIVGLGLVVVAVLAWRGHWVHAGFLTVALLVEVSVFLTVASVIGRDRPDVVHLESLFTDSFPSGHTSAAVVLYGGTALLATAHSLPRPVRVTAWGLAVVVPLAVMVSRLYRGVHYVTDVASGFAVGVGALAVAVLAVWAVSPGSRLARPAGQDRSER